MNKTFSNNSSFSGVSILYIKDVLLDIPSFQKKFPNLVQPLQNFPEIIDAYFETKEENRQEKTIALTHLPEHCTKIAKQFDWPPKSQERSKLEESVLWLQDTSKDSTAGVNISFVSGDSYANLSGNISKQKDNVRVELKTVTIKPKKNSEKILLTWNQQRTDDLRNLLHKKKGGGDQE